jgi:hypothetical protein
MGVQIILPRGVERPRYFCNVPVNESGEACGCAFFEGQERQFRDHVVKCLKRNEELTHTTSHRHRLKELFDSDKELEGWVHQRRDAILEGRTKI